MTRAEVETYRGKLLALIQRIDRDRAQLKGEALQGTGGEASGGLSDVPIHLGDLGSHACEEDLSLSLIENEEQLIEEINGALARLEEGTFGQCEACHKPIAKDRLHALPYTRCCVRCARQRQRTP